MPFDLMNLTMIWCVSFEFCSWIRSSNLGIEIKSETNRLELWIKNTKNI